MSKNKFKENMHLNKVTLKSFDKVIIIEDNPKQLELQTEINQFNIVKPIYNRNTKKEIKVAKNAYKELKKHKDLFKRIKDEIINKIVSFKDVKFNIHLIYN
jgi:hypothetical protein